MKTLSIRCLFWVAMLNWAVPSHAQSYGSIQAPKLLPPSPDAFQVSRYGTIPMGLFTGTVRYEVPVYTLQTSNLSMPISLAYSSNGVKVDLPSSRVGTGWILNAGGLISRTVFGEDDLVKERAALPPSLTNPSVALRNFLESVVDNSGIGGDNDAEADLYSFNFNGFSGNFFFSRQGEPAFYPYQPNLKIIKNEAPGVEWKFMITSADGVKYYFGGPGAEERSKTHSGGAGCNSIGYPWVTNSWYLVKIKHPLGDSIELKYNSVYYTNIAGFSQSLEKVPAGQIPVICSQGPDPVVYLNPPETVHKFCYTVVTNDGFILSEIKSDNATIKFKNAYRYDLPGDSCLSKIEVYLPGSSVPFKKFELEQEFSLTNSSYTNSYVSDNGGSQRLFLLKIKEKDPVTSADGQVHTFEYFDRTGLPPRLSMAQDHFGFFNGASNSSFYPTTNSHNNLFATYGGDRAPNSAYSAKGLLKKITYPTGGYSELFYEQNRALASRVMYQTNGQSVVNGHLEVGGSRIFKTVSYDPVAAKTQTKKYFYSNLATPDSSSAQMVWNPVYVSDKVVRKACPPCTHPSCAGVECIYHDFATVVLHSNSIYPLYGTGEGNVVYSEVIESEGENFENGGVQHKYMVFSNAAPLVVHGSPVPSSRTSNNGFLNGMENYTLYFSKSGSTIIKRKEIVNHFKVMNDYTGFQYGIFKTDTAVIVNKRGVFPCVGGTMTPGELDSYDINVYYTQSYFTYPDTVRTYDYDQSGTTSVLTTTINKFDNLYNLLKTKEITFNSKNEELSVEYKYPYDFKSPGNVYQKMWDANITTPLIEQISKKGSTQLEAVKTNYTDWNSDGKLLVPQTMEYKYASDPAVTRLRYYQYSPGGRPLEVSKESDVRHSYLWGYNNQYPIAEAIHAKQNEIFFDSYEEGSGWDGNLSSYDQHFKRTGIASGRIYKPSAGERTSHSTKWLTISLTAPTKFKYSGWVFSNGPSADIVLFMKTAAEAGYYTHISSVSTSTINKWVFIEGEYTVPANITRLNIRVDNNGGGTVWFDDIRLHPSAAMMKTTTYAPLVGVTSQADANNNTTSYEYDGFGRLIMVRDADGNILKKICYNYAGQPENCVLSTSPQWLATGEIRCQPCPANSNYFTNIQQHQERDNNPASASFNTYRWVSDGPSGNCVPVADWQNTATPIRCQQQYSVNTGYREREQKDMNPCSPTGNQLKWVVVDYNVGQCPLPIIYAKAFVSDIYNDIEMTTATIKIKFFSNAACTVPLPVSNLNVNYKKVRLNCGGWGTPVTNNYSINCSGTEVSLGTQVIGHDDGIHCWEYTFSVTAGTGYSLGN